MAPRNAVEILQPVRVRGERWRVADVRGYETCRVITLSGADRVRRVLTPFDDVEPITANSRLACVTARRWRHACRALIASDTPPGRLRTAARAHVDLLPHQLEPALAVLRGAGSRVLLADDVGLGKTIQAGLIIAELLERGCVERVLILTPAGLRDQWRAELQRRFAITAGQADAATLRALAATLPLGVNPWQTMPIAIASIDYFKRLEVLPAARSVRWDVVVVDEAHASAGDSERCSAVRLVAERAAYVLLLTATPHNGDDAAFEQLCSTGTATSEAASENSDRLLVFRRTRRAIRGGQSRHVHVLRVRPGTAERHMHDALARYWRAVAAEHGGDRALALSVLQKRALSSPWSLAQSVDRRLATLHDPAQSARLQLTLPIGDPDGEISRDDEPPLWPVELALHDVREDRRLLTTIAAAARTAATHDDSKLRCLRRLLRRVRHSALVFTEYRDTAIHLRSALGPRALLLHGGLNRSERAVVLEEFAREPGTILIATDAAGQGLNLHHACRLVVNVELPWNPMRLEQRIGRVDRIGQTGRVHAVHLVAKDTAETELLERLKERVARAQAAIDAPDPFERVDGVRADNASAPGLVFARETDSTGTEVERLRRVRAMAFASRPRLPATGEEDRPLLMHARRRRLKAALAGRTLLIYCMTSEDADGRQVESRLLSLLLAPRVNRWDSPIVPPETIDAWHREVVTTHAPFSAQRLARERAIAAHLTPNPLPLFQPALFDRRAEHAHEAARVEQEGAAREAEARVSAAERQARLNAPAVRLVLVTHP